MADEDKKLTEESDTWQSMKADLEKYKDTIVYYDGQDELLVKLIGIEDTEDDYYEIFLTRYNEKIKSSAVIGYHPLKGHIQKKLYKKIENDFNRDLENHEKWKKHFEDIGYKSPTKYVIHGFKEEKENDLEMGSLKIRTPYITKFLSKTFYTDSEEAGKELSEILKKSEEYKDWQLFLHKEDKERKNRYEN